MRFNCALMRRRVTLSTDDAFQRIEKDQWQAILSVSVLLVDETFGSIDSSILFQHRYSFKETILDKTPTGFVGGMSRAMQKFSQTLIEDVFEALTGSTDIK